MKICVVTASIGNGTDQIRCPKLSMLRKTKAKFVAYVSPGAPALHGPWERREIRGTDPAFLTRMVKIMCHTGGVESDADFWIWMDASFKLRATPESLVKEHLLPRDFELVRFQHPWHKTIIQEAQALKDCGKVREADWPLLDAQVADYAAQGWKQAQHSCGGFLIRRNCSRVKILNEVWFDQVKKYRHCRDQMSFDYAIWKSHVRARFLPGPYYRFLEARFFPDRSRVS